MRIYKRRPFSLPNSVKVDALCTECDKIFQYYQDLNYLKKTIKDGKLTRELYDFLNTDGSMDELFNGLPKPITGIQSVILDSEQILIIDKAIEFKASDIKKVILAMWEAFKEWFLDWWNVNRQVRFDLQAAASKFRTNPEIFGYDTEFRKMRMVIYSRTDWETMVGSCEGINKLLDTLPEKASDLRSWLTSKADDLSGFLAEFGQSCTLVNNKDGTSRYKLGIGNPAHDQVEMTMDSGRWVYTSMATYADRAVNVLLDDFKCRRRFGKLESMFKTADAETLSDLTFMHKLCERHAANVFVVADALLKIFKTMKRNAVKA